MTSAAGMCVKSPVLTMSSTRSCRSTVEPSRGINSIILETYFPKPERSPICDLRNIGFIAFLPMYSKNDSCPKISSENSCRNVKRFTKSCADDGRVVPNSKESPTTYQEYPILSKPCNGVLTAIGCSSHGADLIEESTLAKASDLI